MTARRVPHPAVYALLITPFGIVGGFNTVALVHLATSHGLTEIEAAGLAASGTLAHTIKFLWAPAVDTTLSRKGWYVLSAVLCAVGVLAMSAVPLGPSTYALLTGVIIAANVAITLIGMAVEGLMAHLTDPSDRGRVSGWFQAGNLGGGGIGGAVGLWLVTSMPAPWMAGAVLAGWFLLCIGALRFMDDVPRESRDKPLPAAIWDAALDFFRVWKTRNGLLAGVICFLPVGTGAATITLSVGTIAAVWGAGEAEVGMVQGWIAGIISAIGCLAGGYLGNRWHPRHVYVGVGAVMAAVTGTMAFAPFTVPMYVAFCLVYAFVAGLAYAAYTGFVLDAIGTGAAATKFNGFASLANVPIAYLPPILAAAFGAWGAQGMLLTDAALGLAGLGIITVASMLARGMK